MSKQIQENKKCGKAAGTNTAIYGKRVFFWVVTVLIFFAVSCETRVHFRKRPGTIGGVLDSDVSLVWEYRAPVKVIVWYNGSVADPCIATYIIESDEFTALGAWRDKLKFESSNSSDGYSVANLTFIDFKPSDAGNYTAIFDAAGDTDDTVSLEVAEADDSENQFISTTAASNAMTTSPVPTTWISTLDPNTLFAVICVLSIICIVFIILRVCRWYRGKREKPKEDAGYTEVPAADHSACEMPLENMGDDQPPNHGLQTVKVEHLSNANGRGGSPEDPDSGVGVEV